MHQQQAGNQQATPTSGGHSAMTSQFVQPQPPGHQPAKPAQGPQPGEM